MPNNVIPSLDILPVPDILNPMLTVRTARMKLQTSADVLGQILAAPSGVPIMLKRKLDDALFHTRSGLSFIDTRIGEGYNWTDTVSQVKGLEEAIQNHANAVRQAKPLWKQWVASGEAEETPPGVPEGEGAIPPNGNGKKENGGLVDKFSRPTPLSTYIGLGIVGLSGILVWRLFK
jgi:hypothetical protein